MGDKFEKLKDEIEKSNLENKVTADIAELRSDLEVAQDQIATQEAMIEELNQKLLCFRCELLIAIRDIGVNK